MSNTKKMTGLGKGLGALLPSTVEFTEKGFKFKASEEEEAEGKMALLDVTRIKQNPYQPRKDFDPQGLEDLKNSIIEHGVIQPVTVRRSINGYELISGERRLRAVMSAGLSKIPAYILDDVTEIGMLAMALIENLQRENLNPIEVANGYNRLIEECSLTQEQVAQKVGKDRTTITNFLRLLKLPEKIQESLRKKEITMGHARALLALSDVKKMLYSWNHVVEKDLSVRDTETLARDIESGKLTDADSLTPKKKPAKSHKRETKLNVSPETAVVLEDNERRLRHLYGTQVKINPKDEDSGTIEFEFYSKDDLDRLIDMFTTIEVI